MDVKLNVNEILDFAVLVEEKGYAFYTATAKKFPNEKLMQLFHLLAEQEMKHERIFKQIKEKTASLETAQHPDISIKDYLKGFIFGDSPAAREKAAAVTTIREAIDLALDFEKDSVVFYNTLKNFIGKEQEPLVEEIIQEEISHVLKLWKYKTTEIPAPPDVDAL
jgi:rubrerythrin